MIPRSAIFKLINDDTELRSIGVTQVEAAYAADTPKPAPTGLFILIKWAVTTPAFGDVGNGTVDIWVHDHNRDYSRIDKVIARIKNILLNTVHYQGPADTLCQAEWSGDSGDLFDVDFRTVTRTSSYLVSGRPNAG